ncbi:MAG: isoprenylcysteine carboxylmethyltransferase family protein [Syntrophales bacterium]
MIYAAVFVIGLLLQKFFPIDVLPKSVRQVIAFLFTGVSAILAVWSFVCFWRARTSPFPIKPSTALVTDGPYRFTRNPIYVSLACLYVGLALWFDVFWALVLLPVVIVVVSYYTISSEERYLERKFGEEYLRYKTRVRRWL